MDLSVYSQPRKFKLPHLGTTRYVGGEAVLWALLTGPFYFWKKGAMIEGLVIGIATVPVWAVDTDGYLLDGISGLIWFGAALLAPMLLAMSFERRGWVDVTDRPRTLDLDDGESRDAWSRETASLHDADDDLRHAPARRSRAYETGEPKLD